MGKTLQVAADRAFDQTVTVMPAEIARGLTIKSQMSAQALKLLHVLIAKAGSRMAEPVEHEIRLSDVANLDGTRKHSRATLRPLFEELAVLSYDDPDAMEEVITGFVDIARLNYREEASGNLLIRWRFRSWFLELAASSEHWAIIDRQTTLTLQSKYAINMFTYVSSMIGLAHVKSKTLSVAELRGVLGIPAGKLERFGNMNAWALSPAIAEINKISRVKVTATPIREGRNITAVRIEWAAKPGGEKRKGPAKRSADQKPVRVEKVEAVEAVALATAFPAENGISFTPPFAGIAEAAGIITAQGSRSVAAAFRAALRDAGTPLDAPDIAGLFEDFCHRWASS